MSREEEGAERRKKPRGGERKEPKGGERKEPKGGEMNERKENERRKRKLVLNVMRTHSLQSAEGRRMYNFRN